MRNNYNQDPGAENLSLNYVSYGSGSNFPSTPQRGISEPSLLPAVGNINHQVNSDISSLMSGLVINSKPSFLGTNKPLTNIGLLGGNSNTSSLMNSGVSSSGLAFDPSDFPPIVNSVNQSQSQSFSVASQGRNYVSAIAKGGSNNGPTSLSSGSVVIPNQTFSSSSVNASPEFSIDRDFPALPAVSQGSSNSTAATSVASSSANPPVAAASLPNTSSQSLNAASGDALLRSQANQQLQRSHSGTLTTGDNSNSLQLLPENYVANIPKSMISNQFGMIGLLKLIQIEPTFESLAPGLNLATLGISNWPAPG